MKFCKTFNVIFKSFFCFDVLADLADLHVHIKLFDKKIHASEKSNKDINNVQSFKQKADKQEMLSGST